MTQSNPGVLAIRHHSEDLVALFNLQFAESKNTLLEGGGDEPIYLPARSPGKHNRIIFRHDYFASALHEVAHWCIAGARRRTKVDYGYWYAEDGRDQAQQRQFEDVEIKPQAVEWVFAVFADYDFRVSVDNLAHGMPDNAEFRRKVHRQVKHYCEAGLPRRAELFRSSIAEFYDVGAAFEPSLFRVTR